MTVKRNVLKGSQILFTVFVIQWWALSFLAFAFLDILAFFFTWSKPDIVGANIRFFFFFSHYSCYIPSNEKTTCMSDDVLGWSVLKVRKGCWEHKKNWEWLPFRDLLGMIKRIYVINTIICKLCQNCECHSCF